MTTRTEDAAARAAIRARLAEWARATRAKDVGAIMASYAPETVSWDCHSHLQLKGAAALRRHLDACMPCMQGPMKLEIHDLEIAAHGDVAFCHYLAEYGVTGASGQQHGGWLRVTACLRKFGEKWLIVHDHCSVPFDPRTGRAMQDAAPERPTRPAAA